MIIKSVIGIVVITTTILSLVFLKEKRGEITMLIFSSLIALIICEFTLRNFFPQIEEYSDMFVYDSLLGWKFISNGIGQIALISGGPAANYIKTNSLGFRDHEASKSKKNKIMVLGDSFVSNVSVKDEDVFTEVMENKLKDSDVLNFGVNAYSEVQEYLLLKKWVDVVKPDLVILVVYLENDFGDNMGEYWHYSRPYASFEGEDSILTLHHQSAVQPPSQAGNIFSKSHVNRLVSRAIESLFRKPDTLHVSSEFYSCQSPIPDNYLLRYRILEALLIKIAGLAKEKNVPIVFALAPSILQVEDQLWESFLTSNKSTNKNFVRSLPNDTLMHFAANNNLLMVDLLPALIAENRKNVRLYHPVEVHWTIEGNRVVADALINYLKSKSLAE